MLDVQLSIPDNESDNFRSSSSESSDDESLDQVPLKNTRSGRKIHKPCYLKDFVV